MHPIDAARNEMAAWYAQADRFIDSQLCAAARDGRITDADIDRLSDSTGYARAWVAARARAIRLTAV